MTTSPFELTGKRFLVTGASSGLGRAAAIMAARLGAQVIATGRDPARLNETLARMDGSGHAAVDCNLVECADLPAWIKTLVEAYGPFSGLVHSAGLHLTRPLKMLRPELFDEVWRINVAVAAQLVRGFIQKGCSQSPAGIVLISSVMGQRGQPGVAAYCAGKGGVEAFARAAALELASMRIRVNCVAPGQVQTEMADKQRASLTPEQFASIVARHPLGLGEPDDVAAAICFLLSDAAKWITGSVLTIDGGYTAC